MGMDVYGRKPSRECGHHIRFNVWTWCALLSQMEELCFDLLGSDLLWKMEHQNGDGPTSAAICQLMADRIERKMADCPNGIEYEHDFIDTHDGLPFRVSHMRVMEWVKFVRHSGGFEVR